MFYIWHTKSPLVWILHNKFFATNFNLNDLLYLFLFAFRTQFLSFDTVVKNEMYTSFFFASHFWLSLNRKKRKKNKFDEKFSANKLKKISCVNSFCFDDIWQWIQSIFAIKKKPIIINLGHCVPVFAECAINTTENKENQENVLKVIFVKSTMTNSDSVYLRRRRRGSRKISLEKLLCKLAVVIPFHLGTNNIQMIYKMRMLFTKYNHSSQGHFNDDNIKRKYV